ncbi:DNA breaking-rejoining protein [Escherichia coli]|uniref:DNA breaking-rejoining protein n=1 Tax=Escherichia coli TaxID=562 RepID=UPI00207B295C|nr:DNA breaking-rejoining protein [Escherichia coli]
MLFQEGVSVKLRLPQAELNALSGPAVSLVVFSSGYRPRRGDRVVYDGQQWTVTRHERFNGKPMIFIE